MHPSNSSVKHLRAHAHTQTQRHTSVKCTLCFQRVHFPPQRVVSVSVHSWRWHQIRQPCLLSGALSPCSVCHHNGESSLTDIVCNCLLWTDICSGLITIIVLLQEDTLHVLNLPALSYGCSFRNWKKPSCIEGEDVVLWPVGWAEPSRPLQHDA